MNIQLNGEARATSVSTLDELLTEIGLGTSAVATAVNGDFIPQPLRAQRRLADGDQIEVLAPMQGG